MIKALEVKRLKPLQKNLDCSSVFQEVESGRWLHVEDVDLAMPHPGTLTENPRILFIFNMINVDLRKIQPTEQYYERKVFLI